MTTVITQNWHFGMHRPSHSSSEKYVLAT